MSFTASQAKTQPGLWPLIKRVAIGATHHFRLRVSDWFITLMLTTLGLILLQPGGTFETFAPFSYLKRFGSESTWGLVCVIIGSFRLFALVINGTFKDFRWSPYIRAIMAVLSCFIWFQLATSVLSMDVWHPGASVYPYLFLFDIYNASHAAAEAGVAERRHRILAVEQERRRANGRPGC